MHQELDWRCSGLLCFRASRHASELSHADAGGKVASGKGKLARERKVRPVRCGLLVVSPAQMRAASPENDKYRRLREILEAAPELQVRMLAPSQWGPRGLAVKPHPSIWPY